MCVCVCVCVCVRVCVYVSYKVIFSSFYTRTCFREKLCDIFCVH